MKTFYVSLLLFALLLTVILLNMFFVRRVTQDMLRLLDELPPCEEAADAAAALADYWSARKMALGLSVCEDAMLDAETHLIRLLAAADQKEASDFETATRLARTAILRIRDAERFTADNLF